MTRKEAKDELIEILMNQVMDLTMMSKIELGDDVIEEIQKLQKIINKPKVKPLTEGKKKVKLQENPTL